MAELVDTVQQMIQAELAKDKFLGRVLDISGSTVKVKRPTLLGGDDQYYQSIEGVVAGLVIAAGSLPHQATAIPAHTATAISAHPAAADPQGGFVTVGAHSSVTIPPHGSVTVPAHAAVTLRAPLQIGDTVTVERFGANWIVTGKVAT